MSAGIASKTDRSDDLQVGLAMASVGFYTSGMGAVLAGLAAEFGVAPESLSWVGSTFGFGLLVVAVLGRFALRRGPRVTLLASGVGLALGSALTVFSPTLILVFVGAVLQGLSTAAVILVAPVMLVHNADLRLTRVNAIASLVGISAPLLVGAAVQLGLPGRYAQLVLLPMMAWLLVLVARHLTASGPVMLVQAPTPNSGVKPAPATILRRWLAITMAVSVEFSYVVWGVSRLAATGIDTGLAATLGIAFPVGMATGRLIGPALIRRVPAVPFGVAMATAGTLLVVFTTVWPAVAAGLVLAGLGVATMYPVTLARLMSIEHLNPAQAASVGALASGVAIVVAPIVLAGLATVVEIRWAFLAPLPLLALLLILHGRSPKRSVS